MNKQPEALSNRNVQAMQDGFKEIFARMVAYDNRLTNLHNSIVMMTVRMDQLEQTLKAITFNNRGPTVR